LKRTRAVDDDVEYRKLSVRVRSLWEKMKARFTFWVVE
jgi:hypothetical protein